MSASATEIQELRERIEGLRRHLDTFSHTVFCELEVMQSKLNRIMAEVAPPKRAA